MFLSVILVVLHGGGFEGALKELRRIHGVGFIASYSL